MSRTNEGANASFRGLSRPYSHSYFQKTTSIFRNVRILEQTQVDNYLHVKRTLAVGGIVEKDMDNQNYTSLLDPESYQSSLFPDMADFIEDNIEAGDKNEEDRFIASWWTDLGDDVFDDWGYFFIYDVARGKYYFPLLSPQNQSDGVMTTQFFNCFDVQFTVNHGWRERGIFMIDIVCNNNDFIFRFGAYGDLGSDGNEDDYDMSATYGADQTLFYHHHAEQGDPQEVLYSYFVPYRDSDKTTKSHESLYDVEDHSRNSLITKELTLGVKVYFSKEFDVSEWVIIDITTGDFGDEDGNVLVDGDVNVTGHVLTEGNIVTGGYNIDQKRIIFLDDEDTLAPRLINTYFVSNGLSDNRTLTLPNPQTLFDSIPNCREFSSFRFTINNYNNGDNGYAWNISTENGYYEPIAVKNFSVPSGSIISYSVIFRYGEGVYAELVQESEGAITILT
jgi:hypothetical protein